MQTDRNPVLLLVSAPSGAGKTTLCKRLLAAEASLKFSISATTRPPRESKRDGVDYHFISRGDFEAGIGRGDFLEHATVYGNYYGTPLAPVQAWLADGYSVLLDIDVQGAEQIRAALLQRGMDSLRRAYVDVFIAAPSLDSLRSRLVGRATDAPDVIERRMRNAEAELRQATHYAYSVINHNLEHAFADLHAVYRAAGLRTASATGK